MDLDSQLLRTRIADDETHGNHLRVPLLGILDFRLKAGTPTSRFILPEGAIKPDGAATGSDDFHFIPEKETIEIRYEIDDPFEVADEAKLELFTRFEKDPLWTLDLAKLGQDWYSHGKHVVKWDGRIVVAAAQPAATDGTDGAKEHDLTQIQPDKTSIKAFFDGFITLEFPPYKLRLTVGSKKVLPDNPAWAWTYFHILLKSLELDLGPEEAIPAAAVDDAEHKRNKAVRAKIETDGKVPADNGTRKIMLISNIFKTTGAEMGTNMTFSEYQTLWSDGPQIPIIAKIRLRDSADNEVKLDESDKGAVALGNTRFLWDWEDPDELVATQAPGAKPTAFINDAINYEKAATDESPKGDNCHLDRGGKRGAGAKVIFPAQAGYDPADTLTAGKFPFKIEKATTRQWGALSTAWTKGKLKGQTGVAFQPSRMAGDDYKLAVYLANDKAKQDALVLDVKTEPLAVADDIVKKSGKFQVWRELHLSKYVRKKNTIADFVVAGLGAIRNNYNQAYVEIVDKTVKSEVPTAGYDALAKARITGAGDALLGFACDPAADHSTTASAFLVRSYLDCRAQIRTWFANNNPTLLPAAINTAADNWFLGEINGLLQPNVPYVALNEKHYANALSAMLGQAAKLLTADLNTLNGAADGITIVHFDFVHSVRKDLDGQGGLSTLNGSAIDVPGATRNKCCFVLFVSAADTFVHEIGHHLFLAHFGPKPDSFDAVFHDSTDLACIMTYNRPRPDFCGFCMLRLRGWNSSVLNADGTQNHSP